MKILSVGLNWRAPVRIRERAALDRDGSLALLGRLRERVRDAEFAVLSTCNRTEIYSLRREVDADLETESESLRREIADLSGASNDELAPYLYVKRDIPAAKHLFVVAAGLDSLVLGEGQILGQVREAYQLAVDSGVAGRLAHSLFQPAIGAAKRVQNETELNRGKLSIAGAAVEFLTGVFDGFSDKTVMIIGAGKMASLTVKRLLELGPRRVAGPVRRRRQRHRIRRTNRVGDRFPRGVEGSSISTDGDYRHRRAARFRPGDRSLRQRIALEHRRSRKTSSSHA